MSNSCNCNTCENREFFSAFTGEGKLKDDYMKNKHPSIYEQLDELHGWAVSPTQRKLTEEIMSAVNSIDNELIALALELPTEQAEKLLEIQERLY
ncbi:hypothetical protein [Bacillus toyonensis]|jgi:hypothetical protein|uniref:hypothetical protein n=1 Tax=Bacillus toyonensis TaxID=155322 RepID=UPI000BF7958A|nr:hypothetical protein [Bacillus toyonensis]PFY86013.1 hypothetical protein COL62_02125 [Bacillus toyonensis]PHD51835.1 hypothetical protein COF75_07330 [Bacillus toyonensis]